MVTAGIGIGSNESGATTVMLENMKQEKRLLDSTEVAAILCVSCPLIARCSSFKETDTGATAVVRATSVEWRNSAHCSSTIENPLIATQRSKVVVSGTFAGTKTFRRSV